MDILDMNFDDDLRFANSPKKDNQGFVKAKITKIEKTTCFDTKERTSKTLQDDKTYIAIQFNYLLEGITETINGSLRTGTNLNPEKVYIKAKGRGAKNEKPEYNAFTEMCLRLGLIDIKRLEERDYNLLPELFNKMKNVSDNNPIYIKTKLTHNENNMMEILDIRTVELIEKFDFDNKKKQK
jgi:hypothetical protein